MLIGIFPLVILNGYASYVVATTYFEIKERRFYQLLFIWLVPLIGALLVIFINREEITIAKPKRKVGNNTSITNLDRRI